MKSAVKKQERHGKKALLDTDILIEELRQLDKETLYKTLRSQDFKLYISAITITELWTGESITKPKNKKEVTKLLKKITVIPLTDDILKRAGDELRKDRNLYLADALVAGTCLVKKLSLATLNRRHFEKIKGLKLLGLKILSD